MGQTNMYGERRLVYVTPVTSSDVRYGFKTAIDTSESDLLGQTAFTIGTMVNGITFGARYPRPAKYKKDAGTYSVSSFANVTLGTGGAAVYKKVAGPKVFPYLSRSSGKSVLCFCTAKSGTTSLNYAWYMPKYLYDQISGVLTGLGINTSVTSTNQKNVIFAVGRKGGTRGFPVPARYTKTFGGEGESGNTVHTYGAATALPAGWTMAEGPIESI